MALASEYADEAKIMKNMTVLYVIAPLGEGEEGILRKIRNKDRRPSRRTLTGVAAAPTVSVASGAPGASVSVAPAATAVHAAATPVAPAPVLMSVTGAYAFRCLCHTKPHPAYSQPRRDPSARLPVSSLLCPRPLRGVLPDAERCELDGEDEEVECGCAEGA